MKINTYVHLTDCIAAIATPPGEGSVAVVRISGKEALAIADRMFSGRVGTFTSHTVHFGQFMGKNGQVIDEGLLIPMKGPHSYTGEDVVELQCHGGSLISEKILSRALELGARLAKPGEFTFRAFKNGRLDLAQAEAVQELIAAKNDLALDAAKGHLEGCLSRKLAVFQHDLLDIAAEIEAWIDYPEEELEIQTNQALLAKVTAILQKLARLQATYEDGQFLQTGYKLCLIGAPNVGKSSLMNRLLGKDRAIVTEIAGTTRDLLEEDIRIGKLHFRLVDTAGIRETTEVIEKEGIRRSKEAAKRADVIVMLLDATREKTLEEQKLIEELPSDKTLVVWNKIDARDQKCSSSPFMQISVLAQLGIDDLKERIVQLACKNPLLTKEEIVLTKRRHYEAIHAAALALSRVEMGIKDKQSPEFLAIDLRESLDYLSTITGNNVSEDILGAIFSKFCVGK